MNKIALISCIIWPSIIIAMMGPYSLPEANADQPIGGSIHLEHNVLENKFRAGENITPLQVLELPLLSNASAVRTQFQALYLDLVADLEEQADLEDHNQHPDYLLLQLVGRKLNLLDAEGNFIPYANPLPTPAQRVMQVEEEIANQAALEQNHQDEQNDDSTWLDHWLTPALVRHVYFWWKGD